MVHDELLSCVKVLHHKVQPNTSCCSDLKWWELHSSHVEWLVSNGQHGNTETAAVPHMR